MSVLSLRRLSIALVGVVVAFAAPVLAIGRAEAAPSWWRVSNGHAEVWILGAPRIVPRDLAWDSHALDHRLSQANTLIVGPRPKGSLQAAGLVFSSFSLQPLEQTLPADLRRRFVAARQTLGKGADRYANWKPAAASKLLLDDFFAANNLQQGGVEAYVTKLAESRGVHDTPAGTFDPQVLINQAKALTLASQLTCLDASVHDVERGAAVIRNVAADWARGGTGDAPIDRIDSACVATLPAIGVQADVTLAQESAAVAKALNGPGHAVAVFELHNMTQPGGVIDRLRAMGLDVSGPTP
jgi:uncharacterized protein YbaP (TraB family)